MGRIYFIALISLIIVICRVNAKNEQYMGYKVYNIKLGNIQQQEELNLIKNELIDYWRKPSFKYNVTGQAMTPPSLINWFEKRLAELDIAKNIIIEDVYKYLKEKNEVHTKSIRNEADAAFNVYEYNRYSEVSSNNNLKDNDASVILGLEIEHLKSLGDERSAKILNYLRALETTYENSRTVNLKVVEADTTAEGRPLIYVQLTNITPNTGEKPVIIIEAGINPRQWITIPSSLNVVEKLLNTSYSRFLDNFEWVVIPVMNPDGYEYTHTNMRLWMKSRSTRSHLGAICPGVNINRNFDIAWLLSDSSSSPCSHLYGGIETFSEAESRLVQSLLESYGSRIRLYISLQNTGGFISYPWQYERAASGMFVQHHLLGLDMVAAMGDPYYLDGASTAYGDRASGTSTDYMRTSGVPYTFNIDIAPSGEDGVIVSREEIPAIAENVWRAVSVAAESLL